MKSLIFKILISFIIVGVLLQLLSTVCEFGLQHNCNLKTSYIQKGTINADILFLGPCQVEWIIQPALIEKNTQLTTYNLGLTHANFADNYLNLYLYLQHNKSPKYLFLYVSPESMDLKFNMFNTYSFASSLGDSTVKNVIQEYDNDYFKWSIIPFMQYAYYSNNIYFEAIQGLIQYKNKQHNPYYKDGFTPPLFLNKPSHSNEYISIYPSGYSFLWNTQREKYLRKTIELALQKNIRIYLYESPIVKEALKDVKNREDIINRIKKLASEYEISYLQFENADIANSGRNYLSTVIPTIEASAIFSDSLGKYISHVIEKK